MTPGRKAIKDAVIVIGILVLLLLLVQLFLRPPQPARDFVFGELGRAPTSLTNRTETPFPPSILTPTNAASTVPPAAPFPVNGSNDNASLTPEPPSTNDALRDAVARAMAAPPIVRGPGQSLPPLAPPPETGPANPVTPAPPYIPRTSEPTSKASTAQLLATTEGYTPPAQADMRPKPTSVLLGLGPASQSASNRPPVAAASSPVMTNVTNFSFIVDQSLSMIRDGKTIRARSELLRMLETLGPENTFYVLLFHSGGYEGMPGLGPVPATPENIRAMTNWLFSAGHRFGSDPSKGMRRALHMIPAPNIVWLISDGGFSRNAVQAIREANQSVNARINTIDLNSVEAEPAMRQIADENGGTFRFIPLP